MSTVHQRCNLFVIDHHSIGLEWLEELLAAGARVCTFQLQDHGELDAGAVRSVKDLGYTVWGAIRPSGEPLGGALWDPVECASWAHSEIGRCRMGGLQLNAEAEVQRADLAGERWSERFVARWRQLRPRLASQLLTYPIEGLQHEPYKQHGFRLSLETYSDTSPLAWAPNWLAAWAMRVGWKLPNVKLCLPVQKIGGTRPPPSDLAASAGAARTIGATLYPVESAMPPESYPAPLIRELLRLGAVRL